MDTQEFCTEMQRLEDERDPIGAQDRKDAMRYRWLRSRELDSIVEGGIFAGKVPDNVVINGADLDREIDEAMLKTPNV